MLWQNEHEKQLYFLSSNKKVCATVIEDGGYIMDECEHEYKSVVFWGDMQIVNDLEEKKHGMNILLHHLEDKDLSQGKNGPQQLFSDPYQPIEKHILHLYRFGTFETQHHR